MEQSFLNTFSFQDVHSSLLQLLSSPSFRSRALYQITTLQQSLLHYFNSHLPQRAKDLESAALNNQSYAGSKEVLKTVEIKILKDMERLVGVMTDVVMVQQFFKMYATMGGEGETREERFLDESMMIRY